MLSKRVKKAGIPNKVQVSYHSPYQCNVPFAWLKCQEYGIPQQKPETRSYSMTVIGQNRPCDCFKHGQ
jgi:hypothetical protein